MCGFCCNVLVQFYVASGFVAKVCGVLAAGREGFIYIFNMWQMQVMARVALELIEV